MNMNFLNWALDVGGLTPVQKITLINLVDLSNEVGECQISIDDLTTLIQVKSKNTTVTPNALPSRKLK